ncbi:SMI1/KNR4 family protein [Microcoleus sp. FACHB-1515]|uniref:SMI1/KNR4 family protein n=1 Tax=Cyanophyceae TaxID=3028117 RepID=UPI001688A895|nr:SMI1/KNR4 family protein [Microcoleus sp. FACHB-1515]MBD2092275.1 SMI1/KNR4 family protein [Microcoleus sp. FACHB-1515]
MTQIDCDRIHAFASTNAAATPAALEAAQATLGCVFPPCYVALLQCTNGLTAQAEHYSLLLYSTDELAERNITYEVAQYLPDFLMIGDDGGGRGILISQGNLDSPVYLIGMGSMQWSDARCLAVNLAEWIQINFAIDPH